MSRWTLRATAMAARLDRLRVPLVVFGTLLFASGLLVFAYYQTQFLFRGAESFTSVGATPRNDGGILFGGITAMLGLVLGLFALSPLPPKRRLVPASIFTATTTLLFFSHFSIYVNALTIPRFGMARIEASFLFHDAASSSYIATFSLAMITGVLLFIAILAGLTLVVPDVLRRRITQPTTLEEHRVRLILLTLVLIGTGITFGRQFFAYAIEAEGNPRGSFFVTNLIVIYYALGLAVFVATVLAGVRAYALSWGDTRTKRTLSFQRNLVYLLHAENWLWGMILALNFVILASEPLFEPNRNVDRVFVMSSKGASILFLIVGAIYLVHRMIGRSLHRFIRDTAPDQTLRPDRFTTLAALIVGSWVVLHLALLPSELSQLSRLAIKFGVITLLIPFFVIRVDIQNLDRPHLRSASGPLLLVFSSVLGILTGIMLWGIGNTVVTAYSPNGGFIHEGYLSPFAIGIRALGSLFIAAPTTFALWYITTRFGQSANPGPLLVVCFSIVIAMNLLLTVNATDTFDAAARQTDVLIGFGIIGLSTFDQVVVLILWAATTVIGFVAAMLLIGRGSEPTGWRRHVPERRY